MERSRQIFHSDDPLGGLGRCEPEIGWLEIAWRTEEEGRSLGPVTWLLGSPD